MTIKEVFDKAENGTLTWEQFQAAMGTAKFVDLTEGHYVSKQKYDDEAAELGKRLSEARTKKKQLDEVLTLDNKWLSAMREAEYKTEVDSELVKHLIKAVKIYEEKRVEVELNFGEQKKVMERIIGEMMEGDSDE